jgi:serine/threonine-protein kinase
MLQEGDLFADRYEVQKLLGRGGMGMVYLVKDWKTHEIRALKMILPKFANNKQAVRRFNREVTAAKKIDHPCVVKIFDADRYEDTLYYIMEYLDGKSLRGWMVERFKKGKRVGMGSTVRILSMICHALEQAHQFTIHRDLSPENIMVLKDGNVKLLDFGLAKLEEVDPDLTRVGISLGKIQYGAPEQRADAKNVDHRADIFSLGIMFYELLTSEIPMGGRKMVDHDPDLLPECDEIAEKATAENPDDRYQTAKEFRFALTQLYQHYQAAKESGDAVPITDVKKAKPPKAQRRTRAPQPDTPIPEGANEAAKHGNEGKRHFPGGLVRHFKSILRRVVFWKK